MQALLRNIFRLVFLAALVLPVLTLQSTAQSSGDPQAITDVIRGQLDAFAADRPDEAYSYAAPMVQQIFPTVDQFMAMVKGGYQPVYRNTKRSFGPLSTDATGRPTMRVGLTTPDGKHYEATYTMEQQADGTWKIAGCRLEQVPGLDV